jgi:hypothetical protein
MHVIIILGENMKYLAIICDIKESKKAIVIDHKNILFIVQKKINTINKKYSKYIAMNFTITTGDEFQALLSFDKNFNNLFELITYLEVLLSPLKIRIGLGIGELTNDSSLRKDFSIGTNGQAWWNARDMIEEVKEKYEKKVNVLTNIRIKGFLDCSIENLTNLLLMGLFRIQKKWKEEDFLLLEKIIENVGIYSGFSQVNLAKKIGESEKAISRRLNRMNFYYFLNVTSEINKLIGKELENV